jgi:signal peptidase II
MLIQKEKKQGFLMKLSYGLILGGALSNLLDRVIYGYVIDYIDIRIWPVFNLSDTAITTGVFLIFLSSFRFRKF